MPTSNDIRWIHKGMRTGGLIGGVAGGVAGAAGGALPKTYKDPNNHNKVTKRTLGQRIAGGVLLGASGAYTGHHIGRLGVGLHRAHKVVNKGFSASAVKPKTVPDWLKGAKTKAEGRKAYKTQARKVHPDLHGGNDEHIKKLNIEWEDHEPHFKTAMLHALADELEKIAAHKLAEAGTGAVLGGTAGYMMAPNSVKGKVVGAVGGALVGHLAGKGLGAAKQQLIDQPHAYEQQQLYGYQPSAGQQPGAPRNW